MEEEILKTDVDEFLELVARKGMITIKDAAATLGVSTKTVEAWADFLVEERILGTEYKFTTQYVFVIHNKAHDSHMSELIDTKEEFFSKAKARNIPPHQIKILWLKYLSLNEDKIKNEFMKKAKQKGLSLEKIKGLWEKYYLYLKTD